jgi:leucyl-tRNA synthetase
MELVNETYDLMQKAPRSGKGEVLSEAVRTTVILLSPFVPHIAEEMWSILENQGSVFRSAWPSYEISAMTEESVTIAIQVNGKFRSRIEVPHDIKKEDLKDRALSDPKIRSYVGQNPVRDFIVVPKKLINIVV